jgi:hypothetical protein
VPDEPVGLFLSFQVAIGEREHLDHYANRPHADVIAPELAL